MRKIISIAMTAMLLFCLTSCSQSQHKESPISSASSETQESTIAEDTISTTQSTEKDAHNLTASLIIDWIKTYSAENNLTPISDLETKPGKNEGQTVTSFRCINGLVSVSITETNGVVDYIISLCLPTQVIEKVPSDSLAEAAIGAYAYSMIPLFSCEPEIDNSWHQEQFYNAPDEGDSSMVIRSYTSEEWYYTAMVGEAVVTCVAARYCRQCKTHAPNVTFSSNTEICDSCNYNGQGGSDDEKLICKQCGADCTFRGLEEDGRCEDCYNSNQSSSSNGNSANNGNAAQQPSSCSHNYAAATCTKPQTCTKCGATNGTAIGHTYSNATCTAPQKCTVCGTTTGSAAGHKWQGATCTHPETCTVCNATQGAALGHNMGLTKCSRCDYTDYRTVAKSYPNITAYDSKTGEDLVVTNVAVSNKGILSFTFNGKSYSITIKERTYDSMTYFDCYQNGSKLSSAECRIGDASYYNMLHFEWDGVDGHRLYFNTGK